MMEHVMPEKTTKLRAGKAVPAGKRRSRRKEGKAVPSKDQQASSRHCRSDARNGKRRRPSARIWIA